MQRRVSGTHGVAWVVCVCFIFVNKHATPVRKDGSGSLVGTCAHSTTGCILSSQSSQAVFNAVIAPWPMCAVGQLADLDKARLKWSDPSRPAPVARRFCPVFRFARCHSCEWHRSRQVLNCVVNSVPLVPYHSFIDNNPTANFQLSGYYYPHC